ncbi:Disulfide-bond oxidoreductase YfcG [Tritonibacter multivorans]|uniref:Disulfide-bond oxidoreductase YfcG n=1 Tax=Tritonibacter multivorans TaxID=928856 RepID=A0A0P1G8W6_9RHOB|nr:glutathione S-transferase family protein [Tritonibacter multivorans]MDA7421758.1 glutathione S-transferase family protein [Tritonibacter multivorans]CUH77956.1 Disulfide-bond oxidoreductase YfcG [Tritonibacter multivorans]SFD04780.1 glutathione S-transferase [Tritonibacter multivorans]
METTLRLHYAPDNASLIIRLALEELGLAYETCLVDRATGAQSQPAYLALNPNGTIPALETPDGVLFETAAILMWLSETTGKLAPAVDTPKRAHFLKWMIWCSNTFQVDLRHFFYPEKFIGPDPDQQRQLRGMFRARIEGDLDILEAGLVATPGLAGGGTPTLLDIYIPCLLRWTKLYAELPNQPWFELSRYPILHAIAQRAETRASTQAAQIAEGLGPHPFTAPILATPPEGSAT